MSEFQRIIIMCIIFMVIISVLLSLLFYFIGKDNGRSEKRQDYYNEVIREISSEMCLDEHGCNVLYRYNHKDDLNGVIKEYESKWKFEIGFNYGLQKAIRILKFHINNAF